MPTTGRPGVFVTENFQPLATAAGIPGEALPAFAAVHPRGPLAPTLISSWQEYVRLYGDFTTPGANLLPFAVNQFFSAGGSQCFILRIPNTDASPASLACVNIDADGPGTVMTFTANSPGVWAERVYIELATAGRTGRFNVNVYYGGQTPPFLVETFQDCSVNPQDTRYVLGMVNSPTAGSKYVTLAVTFESGTYEAGADDPLLITPQALTGGSDGVTAPLLGASTANPPNATDGYLTDAITFGYDRKPDQVLVLNIPGLSDVNTLNAILSWCAARTDVFLVIDGPAPNLSSISSPIYNNTVTTTYVNMVSGSNVLTPSSYADLYAPWLLVQDPSSTTPGATVYLPPGGQVLGRISATDNATGAYQSPAGIRYGQLQVVDLETRFSNVNLDTLNNAQINAIKMVPGVGFCVFGARTLHPGYPDRYVAVRRMIMQLEHDFRWLCQSALFEPNDARLWAQITAILQSYLNQLLQAGALGGSTPSDSYQVICDSTNNTPATASAGIVNVNVAVALLSPAEYINIVLSYFQGAGTVTTTTSTN
jgi:hypothetical protein